MKMSIMAKIYIKLYECFLFTKNSVFRLYNRWIESYCKKISKELYKGVVSIIRGFWLGVLDDKDFDSIDYWYYTKAQKCYGNSAWNQKGLFEWEKIAIDSYFKRCSSIIVTGAGGGREVIALEKMNYTVDGFESNQDLLQKSNEIIKELGINAKLQLMPRNECPSVQEQYDGGIVGWSMYMHIQGRNTRINFLRGLCTKIQKNGPLLISFYERPYGPRYYYVLTKFANVIRFVLRRKLLEIGDDTIELQYGHYFTREEIGLELHETGFRLVQYTTDRYNNLWDNNTSIYSYAVGIKL